MQELNVQQHDVIPCLFDAWKQVFRQILNIFEGNGSEIDSIQLFRDQYHKSPLDLGINRSNNIEYAKQCRNLHFKTIILKKILVSIHGDYRHKRFELPKDISQKDFVHKVYKNALIQLEKQKGCCALTDINLTYIPKWNQFSFERINNNLPHFNQDGNLPNCIFICRLFNVPHQLSRKMILEYFLTQILVPLSDKVRTNAQIAYDLL